MTDILPVVAAFLPPAVFAFTCMLIGAGMTLLAQKVWRRYQ